MERKIFWSTFTILGLMADFILSALVGTGRYDSNWLHQLVGCLSQRLVLNTVRLMAAVRDRQTANPISELAAETPARSHGFARRAGTDIAQRRPHRCGKQSNLQALFGIAIWQRDLLIPT